MRLTIRVWILIIALACALLMIGPSFEKSIYVKSIEQNSTYYNEGLRAGMKIEKINGLDVSNSAEYTEQISKLFVNGDEQRLSITTDKDEFVFLTNETPSFVVEETPRTNIKTGLDLSGGSRAIVKAEGVELSDSQVNELVSITSNRLNAFGLTDLTIRPVRDLSGSNFMLIEIAGATPGDLKELVGKQGKFEAKIGNDTNAKVVFEGGNRDIRDVCRTAECSGVYTCEQAEQGYYCGFRFTIYLNPTAAQRQADITRNISLDATGKYLTEKLYLYLDGNSVDELNIGADLKGLASTEISIQGSGTGNTQEEALKQAKQNMNRLQTILLTGSLPYKLEIVKLDSISPTLGEAFTKSLIMLGLSVFAIVSLIIFFRYRKIKLTLAVILTMFSEAFITLGIAALLRWNLDAPSIAGIIAGIGVGVNDQIIIIDETESDDAAGIKEKIKRALFIVFGAFFTIIAAMLPLFWAGAGMLKGFALTTIIGVTVGILITRPAFADIVRKIEDK